MFPGYWYDCDWIGCGHYWRGGFIRQANFFWMTFGGGDWRDFIPRLFIQIALLVICVASALNLKI